MQACVGGSVYFGHFPSSSDAGEVRVALCFFLFVWRGKKISGWPSVCGKKAAMKVIHRGVSRDPGPKLITTSTHFWIPMTESIELRSLDGAQQSRCDCNFSLLRPSATTPRLPAPSVIGTEVCSWYYIQSITKSPAQLLSSVTDRLSWAFCLDVNSSVENRKACWDILLQIKIEMNPVTYLYYK